MNVCILHHRLFPASALAGRPLRIIGPGFPGGVLSSGYTGNPYWEPLICMDCLQEKPDCAAYVIQETNMLLNDERMYFDLHLHYKEVAWALGGTEDYPTGVIEMPGDDGADGWYGHGADGLVCLEWGPKGANAEDQQGPNPLDNWWKGQDPYPRANGAEFAKYEWEDDDPPGYQNRPYRNWEGFVGSTVSLDPGWEKAQFVDAVGGQGFQMDDILETLFDNGFLVCCYGPTTQGANAGNVFNIAALIATEVSKDAVLRSEEPDDDYYIEDNNRYTPLRSMYQSAASAYQILNSLFMPHANECNEDATCPGCDE